MIVPLGSQSKTLQCDVSGWWSHLREYQLLKSTDVCCSLRPISGDLRFELAHFVFLNASRRGFNDPVRLADWSVNDFVKADGCFSRISESERGWSCLWLLCFCSLKWNEMNRSRDLGTILHFHVQIESDAGWTVDQNRRPEWTYNLKWFSEGPQTRTPSLKNEGTFWEDAMRGTAIFTFPRWKLWFVISYVKHSKSIIDKCQTDPASISLHLKMYQLMFPKFMHMLAYSITWSLYSSWIWSFLGYRILLFLIAFKNPMTES
jgi:hypothetical protein